MLESAELDELLASTLAASAGIHCIAMVGAAGEADFLRIEVAETADLVDSRQLGIVEIAVWGDSVRVEAVEPDNWADTHHME